MTYGRSTIKSKIFASAPQSRNSSLTAETLTFKGSHSTDGGNTNVYRVSTAGLRKDLEKMYEVRAMKVEDLCRDKRKIFDKIAQLMTLTSTSSEYGTLVDIIREVFHDVTSVVPGTVGAHFMGCFIPDNFGGPSGCSAVCAGAVQPPIMSGSDVCLENVVIVSDEGMTIQNPGSGNGNAIVHIVNGAPGLTVAQINKLREMGYFSVAIYHFNSPDYTVKQAPQHIDHIKAIDDRTYDEVEKRQVSQTGTSSRVPIYILIALVVIAALGVIFYLVRQHNLKKYATKTTRTTVSPIRSTRRGRY